MSNKINESMSLAKPEANNLNVKQKVAVTFGIIGLLIFALAIFNTNFPNKTCIPFCIIRTNRIWNYFIC